MTYLIVAGIDGSLPSRTVVEWSAKRAASMGPAAELLLVHVLGGSNHVDGRITDEHRLAANRMLDAGREYARTLWPHLSVRSELLEGTIVRTLISKGAAADLIVVGTHKTGFSRGRLLGSRGLQIAAETVLSVAIIPESARRSRSGIVVGVEETPGGAGALEFAAAEAERTNQELTLIRAWTLPEHPPETVGRAWEKIYETEAKRILADAVTMVHRRHRRLITRSRSIRRHAADALLDAAVSARLLVIGAADRDRCGETLGDVGHDVLLNLVGPTVLVHPDPGENGCR